MKGFVSVVVARMHDWEYVDYVHVRGVLARWA